uniref:BTB domain-containing protein n=1 Tax=Biomphalaria glabrata TaxID=6526 RepID=A0A2C9L3Z0_BIOGL
MNANKPFAKIVLDKLGAAQSNKDNNKLSDVKINIEDQPFFCHRFILCACSDFFKVLLHRQCSPNDSLISMIHITLKGIPHQTFGYVLDAVYRGENKLNETKMIEIWHAAHNLEIDFLKVKCEKYVIKQIQLENYTAIFESAIIIQSDQVLKALYAFLAQNYDHFITTDVFISMSKESFIGVINNCGESIVPADLLVESITKWVTHILPSDEAERPPAAAETNCQDIKPTGENKDADSKGVKEATDFKEKPERKDDYKNRPLEAIFQRHHDEDKKKLCQADIDSRWKHLGLLFRRVNFKLVSGERLRELMMDDHIMACDEARSIVNAAAAERIDRQIPKTTNKPGYWSSLFG